MMMKIFMLQLLSEYEFSIIVDIIIAYQLDNMTEIYDVICVSFKG